MTTDTLTTLPEFDSGSEFQIYIGSPLDRRNGIFHGVYIDVANTTEDEAEELINQMLADSPTAKATGVTANEWLFQGHTTDLEDFDQFLTMDISDIGVLYKAYEMAIDVITEGYSLQAVADYISEIEGGELLTGLLNLNLATFEDLYQGCYRSEKAFIDKYIDEQDLLKDVPDKLRPYFDFERFADDLFPSDFIYTENSYVFRTF